MAWIKSALINTLLILVSIAVTIFLVEAVLHFTSFKLKYLYPLEPGGYLHWDSELGFDVTPNFATSTHSFTDLSYPVWSNSMGCFDTEYDGTAPYIYITGDSFTWGFTPFADKWGKGVQNLTGTRTLTCGVNAFGTRQELIKTRRDLARLPQPPKVIIVGYFVGNDFGDDFAFPNFTAYNGYRVPAPSHCDPKTLLGISPLVATTTCNVAEPQYSFLQKVKFELSLHSVLYMMAQRSGIQDSIKSAIKRLTPWGKSALLNTTWQGTDENNDLAWQIHEQSFLAFKALADQYHAKLLFVLIPEKGMVAATSSTPDPTWVSEKVKNYLASQHIEYLDLWPEFHARTTKKNPFYWLINEHWNVAGNHLAGELVSQYIEEKHLLATSTPSQTPSLRK